jgi:PIN like domain
VRVLFDECVSTRLVRALREIEERPGVILASHEEKFASTHRLDRDWIRALGEEGDWVIVSADTEITRGSVTRLAWREANLTSYFLAGRFAERNRWVQALELVRWCPIVIDHARSAAVGSGWTLPFKGSDPKPLARF